MVEIPLASLPQGLNQKDVYSDPLYSQVNSLRAGVFDYKSDEKFTSVLSAATYHKFPDSVSAGYNAALCYRARLLTRERILQIAILAIG